ncbi:hypothetical protein F5887DRAFT_967060 [Amanita rubescens]|nr:hypothetical protein F5887DRAFT_967060 [Amanita rubescens]
MIIACQVDNLDVVREQNDSYVPDEDDDPEHVDGLPDIPSDYDSDHDDDPPDSCTASLPSLNHLFSITPAPVHPEVFPIQISGAIDTDLTSISASELLRNGLSNMCSNSREPPYAVRHGMRPVSDFPSREQELDARRPLLLIICSRERFLACSRTEMGGLESRWCLHYHVVVYRLRRSPGRKSNTGFSSRTCLELRSELKLSV